MKILTNSTNTKAIALGDGATAVILAIVQVESGYVLNVTASGLAQMPFEEEATLEGIQAKAAAVLETLGE